MLNVKRKIVNVRRKKFLTALVVLSLCMAFNVMAEDVLFLKGAFYEKYRKRIIKVSLRCAVADPSSALSGLPKISVKKLTLRKIFRGQVKRLRREKLSLKHRKKIQQFAETVCILFGDGIKTYGIEKYLMKKFCLNSGSTPGCKDFD